MRQIRTNKRLAAGAFLIVAGPVALGSVAYACQSLATLHANPGSAAAGSTVSLFGANYSSSASATPIQIRLDGVDGPVLATFGQASNFSGTVAIPEDTAVGNHYLVATQFTASGARVSGTPGRANVAVTVAPRASSGRSTAAATPAAQPTAATPAAATSVAAPTAATQAATSRDAATPAPAAPSAQPAAGPIAATGGAPAQAVDAGTASVPATQTATPALAATDTPAAAAAPAAGAAELNVGLQPASSGSTNSLMPGLTLAVGLALVLLSLGAFLKSGRNMFGSAPLA